jgi:competence protein ComEC
MFNRKAIYSILFGLLMLSAILAVIISYSRQSQKLRVIFFNVGQGDAILVSQGQNQMLIDGGKDGKIILEKLGKYVPFWDRTIEMVVATHPDADHIGGLVDVARSYNLGTVMETKSASDSQTYKAWEDQLASKKIQKIEAVKNVTIKFPNGAEADVLYPFSSVGENSGADSNSNSVVIKLNSEGEKFLFTGDLPAEKEMELVNNEIDIDADILKVSHHGSKYATSEEFLKAVSPQEAVISVGKNNSYGHPAPEITQKLLKRGVKIYRTDEMGDIEYSCDIFSDNIGCKMRFN